jgi:tRNA A37 threonylcarbamoyladenosine dehydratase
VIGNAHWRRTGRQHLAGTTVMVGMGSIGAAAFHALAAYGVGQLILVDPDRLRWHNLVRRQRRRPSVN